MLKNRPFADDIIVSSAERFCPPRKFDVIIDIFGPSEYSHFPGMLFPQYGAALKENGLLVLHAGTNNVTNNSTFYMTETGPKILNEPRTGRKFFFEQVTHLPNSTDPIVFSMVVLQKKIVRQTNNSNIN